MSAKFSNMIIFIYKICSQTSLKSYGGAIITKARSNTWSFSTSIKANRMD